jgi:hypothetical protein
MKESQRSQLQGMKTIFFEQPYIFLLIYSFFIMLFFTESSPLFVQNEWVDPNAFFTVGKGMVNGLVPYRDLFEQKGPLLYAMHALAYMISPANFFGVYILESIAMFANLFFAFRISRLYLNWMPSSIITILFPLFILNQDSFRFGDSAEEFSIAFLMAFLFIMLKHFKVSPNTPFKWSAFLVIGILLGCIFWIKFTLVGPWIGFYFAILFITVGKKRWREFGNAIVFTFAGLVLSSIPWFIYFGINHAIKDLINVYIKFNLFTYSLHTSILGKLINCALIFGNALNVNFESKILITIGLIYFMFTWKFLQNKNQKWLFFSVISFLILGVYFGGRNYPYYFLIITPFGLFGLIAIASIIQESKMIAQTNGLHKNSWLLLAVTAVTTTFLTFGYNTNIKDSKLYNKAPLAQQTFAKIMRQEPNPTLLNYGSLDGGFYLAANIVPNVRFFESQNIDYNLFPENMDEQNRYIREGKVQFIVVRVHASVPAAQVHIPHLNEKYYLAAQQNQLVEGIPFKFLLYKKFK